MENKTETTSFGSFGNYTIVEDRNLLPISSLPISSVTSNEANPSIITVTCSANHGLVPGAPLVGIASSVGTNHGLLTGTF
jgi:hypothetical protein